MRLIDADKLLEKVKELGGIGCRDFCVDMKDIISAEEIDAVEVVRCKDCEHCQGLNSHLFCNIHSEYTNSEFFCASGKQRTNGVNK